MSSGVPLQDIGEPFSPSRLCNFRIHDGTVVHIDNFGVAKIKGCPPRLKEGTPITVYVNGTAAAEAVFTHDMKALRDGSVAYYPGSSLRGMPELGVVRKVGSFTNLSVGDIVWVRQRTAPKLADYINNDAVVWLRTPRGVRYGIHPLTRDLAQNFQVILADLHNQIPHVHWSGQEFVSDRWGEREFCNKWDYSQVLVSDGLVEIIGFSIGYERPAEPPEYSDACVYLHRGAVCAAYRNQCVGVGMVGFAIQHALCAVESNSHVASSAQYPVQLQTNDSEENQTLLHFYKGFGGRVIGHKSYPDKTDAIIGFTRETFLASKLYIQYAAQRDI